MKARKPDTLTDADVDAYRCRQVSVKQLAQRHGVARLTVKKWLDARGVPANPIGRRPGQVAQRPPAPGTAEHQTADAALEAYGMARDDYFGGRGDAAAVEQAKRQLIDTLKPQVQQ